MTYNDILKWWQGKDLKTIEDYTQMLSEFQKLLIYNSMLIESVEVSYHTIYEIFEGQSNTPSYMAEEVHKQKDTFQFILSALVKRIPLNIKLLQELNQIYNHCTITLSEYSVAELQDLFEGLLIFRQDPLIAAAYLHVEFGAILPFNEGNGPIGRMLVNYYLMLRGYPPLVIHDEDKNMYFKVLKNYSGLSTLKGVYLFLMEQTIKTWEKRLITLNTAKQVNYLRGISTSHNRFMRRGIM